MKYKPLSILRQLELPLPEPTVTALRPSLDSRPTRGEEVKDVDTGQVHWPTTSHIDDHPQDLYNHFDSWL